jgi:type II secretory ATPase GspE/PulE/Tfp pilus assembly ATPase PilB-like protein
VTFSAALRSILRQDPDVLMIGEMRDAETAEIAVQAAMTGHLVFSTLHTNDAVAAVPRLLDLGVPDYLVAATVEGVLAQRLVRCICPDCREEYQPSAEQLAALAGPGARGGDSLTEDPSTSALPPGTTLMRGAGCAQCRGTGYRGRVGVFELVVMTDELKDAVVRGASRGELARLAEAGGKRSLASDGWAKVRAGLTTVEEVLRVVQQE